MGSSRRIVTRGVSERSFGSVFGALCVSVAALPVVPGGRAAPFYGYLWRWSGTVGVQAGLGQRGQCGLPAFASGASFLSGYLWMSCLLLAAWFNRERPAARPAFASTFAAKPIR